jgi:RNA polymerase sigma-70 factor (ECF subfamily)
MAFNRGEGRELIASACSDPDAFAQLYRIHYQDVFGYCLRRLFDRHHAEDVTSTVFVKVMHSLGSFIGDERQFRTWLFRIATNSVNDHLRDSRRRFSVMQYFARECRTESESNVVLDDHEELLEKKARLKQALLSMKPQYQTVISLHFFEKMKCVEIAACLGKKPSTIRTRLSRATAQLRKKLERSEGE